MNLPDRRAVEQTITSMDAEALAAAVQQGGLTELAERAAMAELVRRVLVDDVEFDGDAWARTARLFDGPPVLAAALALAVWLAWVLAA